MPNPANPKTLALALEELLGTSVPPFFQRGLGLAFDNGQRAMLRFSEDEKTVSITTPIDGAHDGVPQATLRALLVRNGPDGGIAGGSIRVRPGQDYLEIANVVPAELGPTVIAGIAINQSNAAAAIAAYVRDAVAASF